MYIYFFQEVRFRNYLISCKVWNEELYYNELWGDLIVKK